MVVLLLNLANLPRLLLDPAVAAVGVGGDMAKRHWYHREEKIASNNFDGCWHYWH